MPARRLTRRPGRRAATERKARLARAAIVGGAGNGGPAPRRERRGAASARSRPGARSPTSRTSSRRARRCRSRSPRSRSAPRAAGSPRRSPSPAASWSTCRYASKVGVSRKIESREQRAKLREMVTKLLPEGRGRRDRPHGGGGRHRGALPARDRLAPRALEEDQPEEDLRARGRRRCCSGRPASPAGIIRDLFSAKVDALHVDSKELYNEIEQYLQPDRSRADEPGPALHRADAAVRQVRHRVRDPRPVQGPGRAAHRRLADHPAHRGAGQHRRQHRPLHRARRIPRRRSSAPTSRRRARSPGRSGCGTSAASSSATSSTWRPGPTATRCSRSCGPTSAATAPAPRRWRLASWAWSR